VSQFQQKNPTGPLLWPLAPALLVTNSNFGRICYRFRDIDA